MFGSQFFTHGEQFFNCSPYDTLCPTLAKHGVEEELSDTAIETDFSSDEDESPGLQTKAIRNTSDEEDASATTDYAFTNEEPPPRSMRRKVNRKRLKSRRKPSKVQRRAMALHQRQKRLVDPHQELDLTKVILLDSESTMDLFCNRDLVDKIQKTKDQMRIVSNGGSLLTSNKAIFPGLEDRVWFSSEAITNILCIRTVIKKYRVTYDSWEGSHFIVHRQAYGLPHMVFVMHPSGLHY